MGKNKSKQNSSTLSKRWFANATGWGVSFQVGSGEASKVKRSLPVSVEQKFLASPVSIVTALHNTLYTFNPLSVIAPGTGANQRIGSGIKLKGMSFRFEIFSAVTVPSFWRVLVVASTFQYNGTNFGSGLGTSNLFFSGSVATTEAHVDSRLAKVICDQSFELVPRVSGQPDIKFGFVDCMVDLPFAFQTGSVYGEAANLYVVVTPLIANGTTGTTSCGSIEGEVLVSWAD
jgi:hypothetical protein